MTFRCFNTVFWKKYQKVTLKISRFILLATSLLILLLSIGYLVTHFLLLQRSFAAIAVAALVAYLPTLVAYSLTYTGLRQETKGFIGFLMGGMFLKMLIGIVFVVIVALQFPDVKIPYVVSYILCYFAFTGFEVYALMRKLRPNL